MYSSHKQRPNHYKAYVRDEWGLYRHEPEYDIYVSVSDLRVRSDE